MAGLALACALALPATPLRAQNTLGGSVPGEARSGATKGYTPPTGPAPRTQAGKPDFSGVWDHPYVPDMSRSNPRNPAIQKAPGELPYTAAGTANIAAYDPAKNGDYTGMCMPFGLMRSMNSPYPIQIMQNDRYIAFLFEQSTWFHIVPFKAEHSKDPNPSWFGESIAKWDGDTLVVDTVGFAPGTLAGNLPHSSSLHVVERFTLNPATLELTRGIVAEDPVYFADKYVDSDSVLPADAPFRVEACKELAPEYQQTGRK